MEESPLGGRYLRSFFDWPNAMGQKHKAPTAEQPGLWDGKGAWASAIGAGRA